MPSGSADISSILDRILEAATDNLRIAKILVQMGLDPNNVTYDLIFNRMLEIFVQKYHAGQYVRGGRGRLLRRHAPDADDGAAARRQHGRLRVLRRVRRAPRQRSTFLLYLLLLPINAFRLRQMLKLVKKARHAAEGDMSIEWLKPFMTERKYRRGDTLFKLGDPANEMLLTVTGKFLVKEIGVEILPGALMGELGFLTPDNRRTGTVECIEDGQVLTITYDRLLEIYFEDPQFGYYFLVLTSQRLLQNIERLEAANAERGRPRTGPRDRRLATQFKSSAMPGIALLHRAPIARTRADPAEIFDHVRTARDIIGLELPHRRQREHRHDVRGREVAAGEPRALCEMPVENCSARSRRPRVAISVALSAGSARRPRIMLRPRSAAGCRSRSAASTGTTRSRDGRARGRDGRGRASPQVVDDRPGLREHEPVVVDHRRGAHRMQALVLGRREHRRGIAVVGPQRVVESPVPRTARRCARTGTCANDGR